MAEYTAVMMDAKTGNEGRYDFEGADNLMAETADWIVHTFFEQMEDRLHLSHFDYEINGAFKNNALMVATALGQLIMSHEDDRVPFVIMIGPKKKK